MKNNIFLLGIAISLLASCTQNEPMGNQENPLNKTKIKLVGSTMADTKTSIGDKTDGVYPILWSDGDALGLFSTTTGAVVENAMALLSDESVNQNKGVFTSDEITLADEGVTDLYVYYPYKSETTLGEDNKSITSTLSTIQEQTQPGDSHHTGKYGFAYAHTSFANPKAYANFTLSHPMASVKFVISSTEFSAYKLQSVSLYDKDNQTPLSGEFTTNMESGIFSYNDAKSKPYATVRLIAAQKLDQTQELYLTTFPADFTGKEVYVVVTLVNDDQKTVTIPIKKAGKVLKANALNLFTINDLKLSDNSCDWYEPVETRLLVDGWAYGESNCLLTPVSSEGVTNTINVKARGDFMQVKEPKFAKTIFNCDLNNGHKMVSVNGSNSDFTAIANDYNVTVQTIKVDGGYDGGCGQIAIYGDDQNTVLWSFIIWMTPTPSEFKYGNTNYVVMDRNIGSFMVGDDWKSNGSYFQWGRPTMFGWGANGYSSIPTAATDIRFSVENPRNLLYTAGVENTKSDWYLGAHTGARTDRKDDLWGNPNESATFNNPSDGHKSIYDPCPKGYRVISPAVIAELELKGVYEKLAKIAVIKYCYNGTDYTYWPLSGCRWGSNAADRAANNSTTSANYWTNSPATNYSNDADQGGSCYSYRAADKSTVHSAGRSHAFSVRCMKDTENR